MTFFNNFLNIDTNTNTNNNININKDNKKDTIIIHEYSISKSLIECNKEIKTNVKHVIYKKDNVINVILKIYRKLVRHIKFIIRKENTIENKDILRFYASLLSLLNRGKNKEDINEVLFDLESMISKNLLNKVEGGNTFVVPYNSFLVAVNNLNGTHYYLEIPDTSKGIFTIYS